MRPLLVFGPWSAMLLFGRDGELGELDERLRAHRLVTVVGPGGVGKTALVDEVAQRAAARFPLGAHRVDLTRVEIADDVAGALAAQLGFESFDALLDSPGDRAALLVVDNCEHLLAAAAAAISDVLEACRQPTVVATSRSPLGLQGESVLSPAPLAVPGVADLDPESSPAHPPRRRAEAWMFQQDGLSSRNRTIAFESRGVGRSRAAASPPRSWRSGTPTGCTASS